MHQITCTINSTTTIYAAEDGFIRLAPPLARAFDAKGAVFVSEVGILLCAQGPVALQPNVPFTSSDNSAQLIWNNERARIRRYESEELTKRRAAVASSRRPLALRTPSRVLRAITNTPMLIGRHPACDIRLNDPHVSLFHCLLVRHEEATLVVDLATRNGTLVDGMILSQAVLNQPATLQMGSTMMAIVPSEPCGQVTEVIEARSPAMRRLLDSVARVAVTCMPIHLQGETGVGKDIIAREVHRRSGRGGPFIVLNAAGLSRALAGSELFGHVRGAFTGAECDRTGAFEAAHQGSLFLDEIADLPLDVQAELLRAVETGKIRRVGDVEERAVDVRIITATHRNLADDVRRGRFREDLYHRLCVVPLTVPPLRERLEDIEPIAHAFLSGATPPLALSIGAAEKLRLHRWPGNVRELLNVLRRACAFCNTDTLESSDIVYTAPLTERCSYDLDTILAPKVSEAYQQYGSNVATTAQQLGLRRSLVHRLLKLERGRRPL